MKQYAEHRGQTETQRQFELGGDAARLRREVAVTSQVTVVTECILKVTSTFQKHVQENVAPACKKRKCQARQHKHIHKEILLKNNLTRTS
jgi:hypothetical protein